MYAETFNLYDVKGTQERIDSLIEENDIGTLVGCSFGAFYVLARKAMEQIGNPPDSLDWEYASRSKIEGCRGNKFMGR